MLADRTTADAGTGGLSEGIRPPLPSASQGTGDRDAPPTRPDTPRLARRPEQTLRGLSGSPSRRIAGNMGENGWTDVQNTSVSKLEVLEASREKTGCGTGGDRLASVTPGQYTGRQKLCNYPDKNATAIHSKEGPARSWRPEKPLAWGADGARLMGLTAPWDLSVPSLPTKPTIPATCPHQRTAPLPLLFGEEGWAETARSGRWRPRGGVERYSGSPGGSKNGSHAGDGLGLHHCKCRGDGGTVPGGGERTKMPGSAPSQAPCFQPTGSCIKATPAAHFLFGGGLGRVA